MAHIIFVPAPRAPLVVRSPFGLRTSRADCCPPRSPQPFPEPSSGEALSRAACSFSSSRLVRRAAASLPRGRLPVLGGVVPSRFAAGLVRSPIPCEVRDSSRMCARGGATVSACRLPGTGFLSPSFLPRDVPLAAATQRTGSSSITSTVRASVATHRKHNGLEDCFPCLASLRRRVSSRGGEGRSCLLFPSLCDASAADGDDRGGCRSHIGRTAACSRRRGQRRFGAFISTSGGADPQPNLWRVHACGGRGLPPSLWRLEARLSGVGWTAAGARELVRGAGRAPVSRAPEGARFFSTFKGAAGHQRSMKDRVSRPSRAGLEARPKGCLKALGEREQLDLALEDEASFQELRDMWLTDRGKRHVGDGEYAAPKGREHAKNGERDVRISQMAAVGDDGGWLEDESPASAVGHDWLARRRRSACHACGSHEQADAVPGMAPPPRLQVIARLRRLIDEAPHRLASLPPSSASSLCTQTSTGGATPDPFGHADEELLLSGELGAWRCEWTETNDLVCQFATRMTAKEILGLLALYTKLKALKPPEASLPPAALQNLFDSKRALYALTQALLRNASPSTSPVGGATTKAAPAALESLTSTQLVMVLRHLVVLEFHHQLLLLHIFHLLPRRLLLLAQEAREHDARQRGLLRPAFPDLSFAGTRPEGDPSGRDEDKDSANKQQNQIRQLASFIPWQRPVSFSLYGSPPSGSASTDPAAASSQSPPIEDPSNCPPSQRKEALHMVALTFLGGSVAELARTCPSLSFWNNENTRTLVAIIEQLTILNIDETSPVQLTVLATSVCGLHTASIRFLNVLARRASTFLNDFTFSQLTLVANALARLHFAHGGLVKKVEMMTASALRQRQPEGAPFTGAGRLPAVRAKIVTGQRELGEPEEGGALAPASPASVSSSPACFADLLAECDPQGLRSLWYRIALRASTALPKTVWRQQEFLDSSGTWIDANEMLALERAEAAAPSSAASADSPAGGASAVAPAGGQSQADALGSGRGGRFLPASCLDLFKSAEISYDLATSSDVVAYFDPAVRGGTWKRLFFPSSASLTAPPGLPGPPQRTQLHAAGGVEDSKDELEETFSLAQLPPPPSRPAYGDEAGEGVRSFKPLRNDEIRQLVNLLNSFARVVAAELVPLDDRDITGELTDTLAPWATRKNTSKSAASRPDDDLSAGLRRGAEREGVASSASASASASAASASAASPGSSPSSDLEHDVVDWSNVRKVCAAMVNAGVDTGAAQVDNPVFLLFTRAIAELIARQEHMTPQGITSFMNAYSKVRLKGHGRFFFQLKPRILKLLPEFESHQISMALNAFSYFRFDDREVVRGLVNEFMHRRHQGASSIAVSSVILSLAALGVREESVIRVMTETNWITNALLFDSLSSQGLTTLLFSLVCQDAVYEASVGSAGLLNKVLTRLYESPLKRHGEAMLTTCARAIFPCSALTIQDHLRAVENARKHRLTGVDMSSYIRPEFAKKWIATGTQKAGGKTLAWAVRPPPEVLQTPPKEWSTGLKFLADQLFNKGRTTARAKIVPSGLHFQVAAVAHLLGYRVLNEISVFPYSIDIVVLPDADALDFLDVSRKKTIHARAHQQDGVAERCVGAYDMQQTEELHRLTRLGVQSDGASTRMNQVMKFRFRGYGKGSHE
ncbi:hypothetical protein BESB_044930 [Besnoitia besnoiti]|uniref:Uncharacterized protein n=1 Tax=Besnoitia besnoiti TaxID=94643 RepID=A0A2A9MJ72_BESBE|nr:hypothetical protein BESB_044930 [Besnoitia besnoiti]PFH36301.1 hypothetical protein BESB_044930 [Besnoitia besnoiti]